MQRRYLGGNGNAIDRLRLLAKLIKYIFSTLLTVFAPIVPGAASLHQDQGSAGSVSRGRSNSRNAKGQLQLHLIVGYSGPEACYSQGRDSSRGNILELRPVTVRSAS